jgi:hypothetical protein
MRATSRGDRAGGIGRGWGKRASVRLVGRSIVLALALLLACKRTQPDARTPEPPTVEEATTFGDDFAKRLTSCSGETLLQLLDLDMMIDRTIAGRSVPRGDFAAGVRTNFAANFCSSLDPTARMHHLRTRVVDGQPKPLIRIVGETTGLEYLELVLDKHGGTIRAVDLYVYTRGELMSDSMREMLDKFLDVSKVSEANRIASQMEYVGKAIREENWQTAYDAIQRLPDEIRAAKPARQLEIRAASGLADNNLLIKKVDAYARDYPTDPSLDLLRLDAEWAKNRNDEALKLLDSLDKRVGGDPYLDALRAVSHAAEGRLEAAIKLAKQATTGAPDLPMAWKTLLMAQVAGGHTRGALKTLETLQQQFKQLLDEAALRADQRFAALADTQEYAAWKTKQP